MNNSPRNNQDQLREILLDKFENFLDYMEKILNEKLSDAVRMKNISNYTLLINGKGEQTFLKNLWTKFDLIKVAKIPFIDDTIKEFSWKIKSWEYYVVPDYTGDLQLTTIYVFKKKDTLNHFKQKVKDLLESLVPPPEPQYH